MSEANEIWAGDFILTRNLKEEDNTSPGYWNHCAIYIGDNHIVEAQAGPNAVIMSDLTEFFNRYPQIIVLRVTDEDSMAAKMVEEGKALVGTPYRKIASIFNSLRNSRRGENCVTVVRKCYLTAFTIDPGWRRPDDVKNFGQIIYEKNDLGGDYKVYKDTPPSPTDQTYG